MGVVAGRFGQLVSVHGRPLDLLPGLGMDLDQLRTMGLAALSLRPMGLRGTPLQLVLGPRAVHVLVAGGTAGRFSVAVPGWLGSRNGSRPVSRTIDSH